MPTNGAGRRPARRRHGGSSSSSTRRALSLLLPLLCGLCTLSGAAAASNGRIAFATNTTGPYAIWAVNPDGSCPRQLTSPAGGVEFAAHPAFSPDGAALAFTCRDASGDYNICVAAADGTGLRRVTNYTSPHYAMVPAFTANGSALVYESNAHVAPANSTASDPTEIFSVALAGGPSTRLTFTPEGRTSMGAKPSPDGAWLAFASDRGPRQTQGLYDLWVATADGGAPRRLTRGIANQFSRAWSPDSGRIVFNSQKGWRRDHVGAGRLMVIRADGRRLKALTKANAGFPALVPGAPFPTLRGDVTPAWSPDGARIAFASQVGPDGNFEVVSVAAADGRDRVRLTTTVSQPHVTVAWQPVP